jgi:Domain of unknown function (DUF929)
MSRGPANRSNPKARAKPGRSSRKARLAATQQKARRTRTVAIGAVTLVVIAIAVMVTVALTRDAGPVRGTVSAGEAASLAQHVPASVLDRVGAGQGVALPKALPADTPPVEQDGKPEILYVGAEYCPYCAAQRWPLVVALSRVGSFEHLGATESAGADVFPKTPTFTFHGATYTSDVVAFTAVETHTNEPDPAGGYTALDTPTAAQVALLQRYDQQPYTTKPGAIPFLMIGNSSISIGASYDPSVLQGLTRDQIARALSDPTSAVARAVDGSANALTAAICTTTGGKPSSVCSDPVITTISATLPSTP